MIFNNPQDICEFYIEKAVKPGDVVIDATVGNGNDTLKLSNAVGEDGCVFGFDIQKAALDAAKNQNYRYENVVFINDSHAELDRYVDKETSFAIFNLGYLPGGDHSIITKAESTVEAIEKSMVLLKEDGVILLVIYRGGDTGFSECEALLEYLKGIDYRKYTVLKFDYSNRPKNPPIVAVIEKKSVN